MNEKRLRVLRVITRLNVGGPSLQAGILTTQLDPRRFQSLLVVGAVGRNEGSMLDLRPDLAEALRPTMVTVPELGRDPRLTADIMAVRKVAQIVRDYQPDILHTHLAKAGTVGRLAILLARSRPRTVHTFHGTVFEGHFSFGLGRAIAAWERILGAFTDEVVAVSPAVANQLKQHRIGRNPVTTVPLGLELDRFARVPPRAARAPAVIMLIARLAPVKDIPLFIDAMSLVREQRPDVTVRIVGDGPLRDKLQRLSPEWVDFLGNRGDLPDLLDEAGVVVLTSRSEGSPVALIEALAAGRPVVAVPVGGVPDILKDRPGAIVTQDRTARSVAEAVLRVLQDPTYSRAASGGRDRVTAEFGAHRLLRAIEVLYNRLARPDTTQSK